MHAASNCIPKIYHTQRIRPAIAGAICVLESVVWAQASWLLAATCLWAYATLHERACVCVCVCVCHTQAEREVDELKDQLTRVRKEVTALSTDKRELLAKVGKQSKENKDIQEELQVRVVPYWLVHEQN